MFLSLYIRHGVNQNNQKSRFLFISQKFFQTIPLNFDEGVSLHDSRGNCNYKIFKLQE